MTPGMEEAEAVAMKSGWVGDEMFTTCIPAP
jgi:hypothetical protein